MLISGIPASTYTATRFTTPPISMLMTGRPAWPWACMMAVETSTKALKMMVKPRTVISRVAIARFPPEYPPSRAVTGSASRARPKAQGMATSPVIRTADSSVALASSSPQRVRWEVMAGMMLMVMGVMKAQGMLKMVRHIP